MFLRSGFSLIELMVTIALVSLLLVLGVPSFNSVLRNISLNTQANSFVAAINLARSEAIRRNGIVMLSAAATNQTQHHWESGWQIWIDHNRNGQLDNGESLRQFPDMGEGTLVSNTSLLRFNGDGFIDGRSQGLLQFALRPNDCRDEAARDITITPAGRPSISQVRCL